MKDSSSEADLKISFCITCRGADYLGRLKRTLPENIGLNTGPGHHNNVEFVVVAYGDPNVTEWLKATFPEEIKSGLIRAVDVPLEQAKHFKMAHAKNVAHRMATGDVLCNLDCDNTTGENYSGWLNERFSQNPNIVACLTTRDKLINRITKGDSHRDITGRIAISRENFELLHGYNEQLNAARDGDDTNLRERAYASGLKSVSIRAGQMGGIIHHDDSERHKNMSEADKRKSVENFKTQGAGWERLNTARRAAFGEESVIPRDLTGANPEGRYGCAEVTVLNHDLEPEPVSIGAAIHPEWRTSFRKVGTRGTSAQGAGGAKG